MKKCFFLPQTKIPFHKIVVKITNPFRFVKPDYAPGIKLLPLSRRVFLSLGKKFVLVVFDFARVASGQKHGECLEVDDNGKCGFHFFPVPTDGIRIIHMVRQQFFHLLGIQLMLVVFKQSDPAVVPDNRTGDRVRVKLKLSHPGCDKMIGMDEIAIRRVERSVVGS
jgi:hypothetical protein